MPPRSPGQRPLLRCPRWRARKMPRQRAMRSSSSLGASAGALRRSTVRRSLPAVESAVPRGRKPMKRFSMPNSAAMALAFTAAALLGLTPVLSRAAAEEGSTDSASTATAAADQGRLVGLAFAGRSVSNLDRSIAFYEALGFHLDPAAPPTWRRAEVFQRIDGIANARGVTTRRAKMYVNEPAGVRFVIYLRDL